MQKNEKACEDYFTLDKTESDPRQVVLKGFEEIMSKQGGRRNRVKELRLERMMSKAELARRASVSPITISRIEDGLPARLETKRKILEALGFSLADRNRIFFDED